MPSIKTGTSMFEVLTSIALKITKRNEITIRKTMNKTVFVDADDQIIRDLASIAEIQDEKKQPNSLE
jgi:hypothetical protein